MACREGSRDIKVFKPPNSKTPCDSFTPPLFLLVLLVLLFLFLWSGPLFHFPPVCVWHVFWLTFDCTLYVGFYIRLCQQGDPHSFLFGSPARYIMYSSSLLHNWTSLDPLIVLFEALKHMWCFERFFRPQLLLHTHTLAILSRVWNPYTHGCRYGFSNPVTFPSLEWVP